MLSSTFIGKIFWNYCTFSLKTIFDWWIVIMLNFFCEARTAYYPGYCIFHYAAGYRDNKASILKSCLKSEYDCVNRLNELYMNNGGGMAYLPDIGKLKRIGYWLCVVIKKIYTQFCICHVVYICVKNVNSCFSGVVVCDGVRAYEVVTLLLMSTLRGLQHNLVEVNN